MYRISRILTIVLWWVFFSINGYTQETITPPEFEYTRHYNDFSLEHQFNNVFYKQASQTINAIHPNIGGELFYEFELPSTVTEALSEEEIDRVLYNVLTDFQSQTGIEYYSYRRKVYRVFIKDSYTIESNKNDTKVEDFIVAKAQEVPVSKQLYIYQADSSFGDNTHQVTMRYHPLTHNFYLNMENTKTIAYQGFIPIAKPQTLSVTLMINRDGNKVTLYCVMATRASIFGSLRKRISISVVYRLHALGLWFDTQSNKAFLAYE